MIDSKKTEKKWQDRWEKKKLFIAKEDKNKKKYYVLVMYPYPSGSGLHMGHAFNYIVGDIISRFKKMQGYNVLHPMGYDSLGLPAENAAIKQKEHPRKYTEKAIKNFMAQQKSLGISYDWSRTVETHSPEYYKWDQWIFLKMFEKGIAFQKESPVNWCPKCKTVLANEQVHNGKCWRHEDTNVEIKQLKQWFFRITDYADELYESIDSLKGWPERTKAMQKNWIGKSHGTEIDFEIGNKKWKIFTTRPDTIYGVTFMVVSAQHPELFNLVTKEQEKEVEKFLKKLKSVSEKEMEEMEKEGVFTGSYAVNPMTNEKIPVYAGNFVLADYGSGMVMAVPAHDQRDFEFAKKYKIPIKIVIQPDAYDINPEKMSRAYTGKGRMANSGKFNNLPNTIAINDITKYLKEKNKGRKTTQYKLRDWCISRQRYWGTPIPIIYCDKCGVVPVPEKELPVKLPEKIKFGKGNPLETNKDFVNVKCPKCNGNAKRETDTMDTFVNSSWYFLRYCDPKNDKKIFDKDKAKYWMPVDQYIGGAEHTCMHLIYFRFYTKFLRDIRLINIDEPALKLFHQGMLHGPDGKVMSKSRGNVVLPKEVSEKYGIDTARLFLVSIGSPDKDRVWNEKGIQSSLKFIEKVYDFVKNFKREKSPHIIESKIHKTIKTVTDNIEHFRYNIAIIELKKLFDSIYEEKQISRKDMESFLKMLAPFCPHVCEELWEKLGNKGFISEAKWPEYDDKKIDEKALYSEEFMETVRDDIISIMEITKKGRKDISKISIYIADEWKYKLYKEIKKAMEKTQDINEIMKIVMKTEFRKYGKYISKNLKTMVKQMPSIVTSAKEEKKELENTVKKIIDLKCSIIIKNEKEADEKTNKRSLPGKPGIVIE